MEPWFEVERLKIKNGEKGSKISGVGEAGRIFRGPTVRDNITAVSTPTTIRTTANFNVVKCLHT